MLGLCAARGGPARTRTPRLARSDFRTDPPEPATQFLRSVVGANSTSASRASARRRIASEPDARMIAGISGGRPDCLTTLSSSWTLPPTRRQLPGRAATRWMGRVPPRALCSRDGIASWPRWARAAWERCTALTTSVWDNRSRRSFFAGRSRDTRVSCPAR